MTDLRIDSFLQLLSQWAPAYSTCSVSTLATSDQGVLLAGRVIFGGAIASALPPHLSVGGLRFRQIQVAMPSLKEAAHMVAEGAMDFDGQAVRLARGTSGGTGFTYYFRTLDSPEQSQYLPRMPILRMAGDGVGAVFGPKGGMEALTRALQTNNPPYEDLRDLCGELALGSSLGGRDESFLELCLVPPVKIATASIDDSGQFEMGIDVVRGIDLSAVQLGIRVLSGTRVLERTGVRAKDGTVKEAEFGATVSFKWTFIGATAIDLFLSHDGAVVVRARVEPKLVRPEVARVAAQLIDPELLKLRQSVVEYFTLEKPNSRAFEGGISVLLSLSGMRVLPLCAFAPYGEAADICAWLPGGPLFLVEAKTATLLSCSPKIELLADRAAQLRRTLQSAGHTLRVIPVFATPQVVPDDDAGLPLLEQHEIALLDERSLKTLFDRVERGANPMDTARFIATRVPTRDPFRTGLSSLAMLDLSEEDLDGSP